VSIRRRPFEETDHVQRLGDGNLLVNSFCGAESSGLTKPSAVPPRSGAKGDRGKKRKIENQNARGSERRDREWLGGVGYLGGELLVRITGTTYWIWAGEENKKTDQTLSHQTRGFALILEDMGEGCRASAPGASLSPGEKRRDQKRESGIDWRESDRSVTEKETSSF